jgi:DNA segregation ATPase FtsK/SpoIIIE, S-DNA-T family
MAKKPPATPPPPKKSEAKALGLLGVSFFAFLSLCSLHLDHADRNWLGFLGHYTAFSLAYLFGLMSFPLVLFTGWIGWKLLLRGELPELKVKILYFSLFLISWSLLLNWFAEKGLPLFPFITHKIYTESVWIDLPYPHEALRYCLGGAPFYFLLSDLPYFNLLRLLSDLGVFLTFSFLSLAMFLLLIEFPWATFLKESLDFLRKREKEKKEEEKKEKEQEELFISSTLSAPAPPYEPKKAIKLLSSPSFLEEHKELVKEKEKSPAFSSSPSKASDSSTYELPPASLLNSPKKVDQPSLKKELKRQAEMLEETLKNFGIEAQVGEIHSGPTITSFEVLPSVGVKVQKIKTLESDIALNLQAKSIRILAPIPGKAAVGVEIPSLFPQEVSFKELLLSYQQNPKKLHIPVLLGKTVHGENVMSDLTKMPHCIIAGATGSGKSVCINTLILSIIMNATPSEVRLLLIDPKKVELTGFSGLPHLIAPVVTEPHGAHAALNWLVQEMQRRYEILKQLGLRNISAFNSRSIQAEAEAALNLSIPTHMPFFVCIIDEFADLMMCSDFDLETPIARIAQMARAVGIHLILATQRPSREVITGLIKANFPTRIAFKVASRINSQIILDEVGAETLLGNGDLLFLPPGTSHLIRAQGAYVSDEEIHRILQFVGDQMGVSYLIESFDREKIAHEGGESLGEVPLEGGVTLYEMAKNLVLSTQIASTTFIQRKLQIGYPKAASLMDELEMRGIVGPKDGAKPRRILKGTAKEEEGDGQESDT